MWAGRSDSGRWIVHLGALAFCLVLVLLAAPPAAEAQNLPRIGLLSIGADPSKPVAWLPLLERLRELGYVEGGNITIERRFAVGKPERLDELVADLAHLKVNVIVATGVPETLAAKRAMPTTPIVMMVVPDPVGEGLVASLARPGGNVTGLSTLAPELYAKRGGHVLTSPSPHQSCATTEEQAWCSQPSAGGRKPLSLRIGSLAASATGDQATPLKSTAS